MAVCAASQFNFAVWQKRKINQNLAHPSFFDRCAAFRFISSLLSGCAMSRFFNMFCLQNNLLPDWLDIPVRIDFVVLHGLGRGRLGAQVRLEYSF